MRLIVVFIVVVLSQLGAAAQPPAKDTVFQNFRVYLDSKKEMGLATLLRSGRLSSADSQKFVTGYFGGNVWIYFEVKNLTKSDLNRIVSVDYPLIDELDIYELQDGTPIKTVYTGLRRGRFSRELDSTQFGWNEHFKNGETKTFLLRASGNTSMSFPIQISEPKEFLKNENFKDFIFGIYMGLILLIALYNLAIGLAARDITHIYYLFAVIFFHGLGVLTLFAYPSRYFWPEAEWLITRQISVSEELAVIFSLIFTYSFLNVREMMPAARKYFLGMLVASGAATFYSLFIEDTVSLAMAAGLSGVGAVFDIFISGYLAFFKKSRYARFYFVAWAIFFVTMFVFLFKYLGLIQSNYLTTYSLLIGAAVEALILSYALGDKIRKIGEEKIQSQSRALATITMAKSEQDNFIANTSHELRTPVGVILGLTDAILKVEELSPKIRANARMIRVNASRLHGLVNDLLTVGRLKQLKVRLTKSNLSLGPIVQSTLEMFKPSIESKSLKFQLEMTENLPLVKGDQRRIEQILINLLDNAIKFSDEGTIGIRVAELDGEIRVSIRDEGIGIDEAEFENIFIPFKQLDAGTERKNGGLGLGLHIVKDLVELHGGQIGVESKLGRGSTFWFTLESSHAKKAENLHPSDAEPLDKVIPFLIDAAEKPEPSAFQLSGEARARILAVDDDEGNRLLLEQIFPSEQFEIKVVTTATEVLDHIETSWQPDLIIIDLMMPKVSGLSLTKKLRLRYNEFELPIVLLTAKATTEAMVEAFDAGANEFITKPLNAIEVISRVNKHVQLATLNRAVSLFVPPGLVSLFDVKKITDLKLGTFRNLNKVVLFADIRNFSALAERLTDEELYGFTQNYFLQMAPIVKKYDGFIDKFIGDGIMAVFETADNCVKCAIDMLGLLPEYNKARIQRDRIPINMGIGIHSGHVVAGIIGDPERLEATILGDKVNVASRLEQVTKNYLVDIVASKEVIDALSPNISASVRFIDKVKLYGKEVDMEIFEIAKPEGMFKLFDSRLIKMVRNLVVESQFSHALSILEPLERRYPADPVIKMYSQLAKDGLEGKNLPIDEKGNRIFLRKVS